MVIMRSTPAARARATTASRSTAKSGKSRWQWLSISMLLRRLLVRLDIAREHRRRRRQRDTRGDAVLAAEEGEGALLGRHRQQVQKLGGRRWHERQRQNSDL